MRVAASIIHGAYGDCYEQLICLKALARARPGWKLRLYFASPSRLAQFSYLDLGFAEGLYPVEALEHHDREVAAFWQFQVRDPELNSQVLPRLPQRLRRMLEDYPQLLPWRMLRRMLPLKPGEQLKLNEKGRAALRLMRRAYGLEGLRGPTIGFLWRYRRPGGFIRPLVIRPQHYFRRRYSRVLTRVVQATGAHVIVCGMNPYRTSQDPAVTDNKFPGFGLVLPRGKCTYLAGLNWVVELEILAQCTLCAANASGFSEGLWIRRGGGVVLLDPPAMYLARLVRHRMPMFGAPGVAGMSRMVLERTEAQLEARLISQLLN